MDYDTLNTVKLLNPWLETGDYTPLVESNYKSRIQLYKLLQPEWDQYCTVIIGPRQAGKTTMGKVLSYELIAAKRFETLIYLNCDILEIRNWVKNINFIQDIYREFALTKPIIFIDEVQRLENPGLLLKSIIDLKHPLRLIASGSSQLELKSKIKEHLTGRKIESLVLPLSWQERLNADLNSWIIYGSYPKVIDTQEKKLILQAIYNEYIKKDIVETLKIGKPDILEQLIALVANSSGQIVNEHQFSIDCKISNVTIRNYLDILQNTYVISKITPFVGNKRTEVTSRPKYYFIDNGFRNQALKNFLTIDSRSDQGLLVEGAIYQEILKFKVQNYLDFNINFWRTTSGAEVDFILSANNMVLPIEVKYQNFQRFNLSRSFRSFIEAYNVKQGIVITKNFYAEENINGCIVRMIPLHDINKMFLLMQQILDQNNINDA